MKQITDIMSHGFGRYPTAAELDATPALPAEARALLLEVAASSDGVCQAVNQRSCQALVAGNPVYGTPAGQAAGLSDTKILLRFVALAAATGDLQRLAVQTQTWYVDFMSTQRVRLKDVYLSMTYLLQSLDGTFAPAIASALKKPLQMAMGIVENAMLAATAPPAS